MAGGSYSRRPNGNIKPNTFVKLDTSNTALVLQAGAGERVFGIAGSGTRRIALDGYDTDYIGIAGDPAIPIHGPADPGVLLRLGGTVTHGDLLKSDGSGYGVVADTDKDDYGARALASGVSGELIPVEVLIGERSS